MVKFYSFYSTSTSLMQEERMILECHFFLREMNELEMEIKTFGVFPHVPHKRRRKYLSWRAW